jgi:Nif-specific regulatory protein
VAATQLTKRSERRAGPARSSDVALYGVYEISKLLTAPGKLEVTLAKVLQLLSSFLDMRHGLIALLGENGSPEIVVGSGWSEATAKRYFDHLPERAIGRIVVTQMPLVVPDMKEDALFEDWNFSEWGSSDANLAFVGVPVKDRGRVIGTLTIDREHGGERRVRLDEDVRFLAMVANLVGQTVRLHRLVTNDRERLIEAQHRLQKVVERVAPEGLAPRRSASVECDGPETGIIGTSRAIRSVTDKIRIVAKSHSTVLLRGESGTGKELFAKALHDLSRRKERPFVAVNCAALAESVLESELFGHEKGAFTGAAATRKGRFELADGGTLFLDEIGEISKSFQAKLLRVLQEGEFERVGGTTTLKVNVRLVAATNRNLEEAVSRGDFRADLYYRISVVPIFLPPLRDRAEDIPPLAREFLHRFNQEHGTGVSFSNAAFDVLLGCYFPGNVRELENCVRRTATLAAGTTITADDFACRHDECMSALLWKHAEKPPASGHLPLPMLSGTKPPPDDHAEAPGQTTPTSAEAITEAFPSSGMCPSALHDKDERDGRVRLIEAMDSAGWVQAKAARLLGITPRQISYALRKFDIAIKKF